MANINEIDSASPLAAVLQAGIEQISGNQEITFYKYVRQVLPVDGYVFWVKNTQAAPLVVSGSLHYDTDQQQREDETIGVNRVVFTTQQLIQEFNQISVDEAYIGGIDSIRFAFSSHGKKYKYAETFHYRGDAIYPAMYSQIIDNPGDPVDLGAKIATNSLPIWLSLNQYMPIFPAFLVESNLRPPYAAIDISETEAVQSAPLMDSNSSTHQLMTEKVRVTMVGLRNDAAIDFLNYVFNYSLESEAIGIQNSPAIRDEKRMQSELGILAQKKTIVFEVNYYQSRAAAIARKLIESAGITISV